MYKKETVAQLSQDSMDQSCTLTLQVLSIVSTSCNSSPSDWTFHPKCLKWDLLFH